MADPCDEGTTAGGDSWTQISPFHCSASKRMEQELDLDAEAWDKEKERGYTSV
jgi:hypothetical protein